MIDYFTQPFPVLLNNNEFAVQVFDAVPIPIEIFSRDGEAVFINRAFRELYHIPDPGAVIRNNRLHYDYLGAEEAGLKEGIQGALGGEAVSLLDFRARSQWLVDCGVVKEKPFESAFMDVYFSPVFDNGTPVFVLCGYIVKKIYLDLPEVAKIKEHIEGHWREKFVPSELAAAVNMRMSNLYNTFKENAGMTPGEYYRRCKVDHLKEALTDKNLTVKKAFASCGEDSKGRMARVFKQVTGLSPIQYKIKVSDKR